MLFLLILCFFVCLVVVFCQLLIVQKFMVKSFLKPIFVKCYNTSLAILSRTNWRRDISIVPGIVNFFMKQVSFI